MEIFNPKGNLLKYSDVNLMERSKLSPDKTDGEEIMRRLEN